MPKTGEFMRGFLSLAAAIAVMVVINAPAAGQSLGSPDFKPSAEKPVGWRGDWTGRFPGATPPTEWGRWPDHPVAELSCQGRKPAGDALAGTSAVTLGLIHQWLLLGPFPADDPVAALNQPTLPDEASVEPDEDQRPAAATQPGAPAWKSWTVGIAQETRIDTGRLGVDFTGAYGKQKNQCAYAHSYVFCPKATKAVMLLDFKDAAKVWLNGKVVFAGGGKGEHLEVPVELAKGPNRLLVKSAWGDHLPDGAWNSWKFSIAFAPDSPVAARARNIVWMTPLPSSSNAMPLVVGDKVFVMAEPYYLLCIDKKNGTVLWMRSHSYWDGLSDEEKKQHPEREKFLALAAEQEAAIGEMVKIINTTNPQHATIPSAPLLDGPVQRHTEIEERLLLGTLDKKPWQTAPEQSGAGWAVATPCSDGKFVYVHFMNNVVACYDLDGNRQWIVREDFPGRGPKDYFNGHYGFSNSPVLVAGKLITCQSAVRAFDAKTGQIVWRQEPIRLSWGSLSAVKIGGVDYVLTGEGTFIRVSDGKVLWERNLFGNANFITPVVDGDTIVAHYERGGLMVLKLPPDESGKLATVATIRPATRPAGGGRGTDIASPLLHEGLVYTVAENGRLLVADAQTGQPIYQQLLDLQPVTGFVAVPGLCASPVLAGNKLFVLDNSNIMVVIEPGRQFRQVAKNVLWGEGQSLSTPVFDGGRMYYRGQRHLYCIGEK